MHRPLLMGLILMLSSSVAVSDDKEDVLVKKAVPAFPLAKGAKWEYSGTVDGQTVSSTIEVTGVIEPKKKGDRPIFVATYTTDGEEVEEQLSVDDQGVYRHTANGFRLGIPLVVLKYPHKPGKWVQKLKAEGLVECEAKFEALAPQEVTVKAGKYKGYPIKMTAMHEKLSLESKVWYADGVGIVRLETKANGVVAVMELIKFTPTPAP